MQVKIKREEKKVVKVNRVPKRVQNRVGHPENPGCPTLFILFKLKNIAYAKLCLPP